MDLVRGTQFIAMYPTHSAEPDHSQSQYETQLDVWDNRKNLKMNEWADILMIIDKLDPRYETCRVLISGHPVAAARIQRARRHCVAKLGDAKCRRAAVMKGDMATPVQWITADHDRTAVCQFPERFYRDLSG